MEEQLTVQVCAALLSCGHIKIWKPGAKFPKQTLTNCARCCKPREIKMRDVETIYV